MCVCVYSLVYGEKVDVYIGGFELDIYVNNRDGVEQRCVAMITADPQFPRLGLWLG